MTKPKKQQAWKEKAIPPEVQERTLEHLVFAAVTEERIEGEELIKPAGIHLFYGTTGTEKAVNNLITLVDEKNKAHRQFDVKIESAAGGLQMVSVGWQGATRTQINQIEGTLSAGDTSFFAFNDPSEPLTKDWRARLARVEKNGITYYFAATYHPDEGAEIPTSKDVDTQEKRKRYQPGDLFYLSATGFRKHPVLHTSGVFLASGSDKHGGRHLYLTNQKRVVEVNVTHLEQTWQNYTPLFDKEDRAERDDSNPREKYISGSGIVYCNQWLGAFADNIGFGYLMDINGVIGRLPRKEGSDTAIIDLALSTAAEATHLLKYKNSVYVLFGCNHGELRTYLLNKIPEQPRVTGHEEVLTTDDIPVLNTGTLADILSPQSFHFAEDPFDFSRYYEKEGEKLKPRNCCIKQILSWEQEGTLMVGYLYQKTFRVLPFEQLLQNQDRSIRDSVWETGKKGMQLYTFPDAVSAIDVLSLPV